MTMVTPLVGVREPRIRVVPPYEHTSGPEVVELAKRAGLVLDPWQRDTMDDFCAERPDGRWNTFENATVVSRQNGKGSIFEARVLAGLFLFDEPLILYSAHRFATAQEMFRRIVGLITNTDDFRRRVRKVITSHGEEGIELLSGQRLRFLARSGNSGRGFTGWLNILDEAFNLDGTALSALLPTMSAVPNPQLWYGSSAGWEISIQLARLRRRALAALKAGASDPSLAYREYSAPDDTPQTRQAMASRRLWAMANPAVGTSRPSALSEEFTANELRTMDLSDFALERLGIGRYPAEEDEKWLVIPEATWEALADTSITPADRVGRPAFCAESTPDRSHSAIAVAFYRPDGGVQWEVVDHWPGTGWVASRLRELKRLYDPCATVVDKGGPAASVVDELEAEDEDEAVEVVQPTAAEITEAYGQAYQAITETASIRHCDQEELNAAVAGAGTRKVGDRTAWDRYAGADSCPLVAATGADWGLRKFGSEGDALDNIW